MYPDHPFLSLLVLFCSPLDFDSTATRRIKKGLLRRLDVCVKFFFSLNGDPSVSTSIVFHYTNITGLVSRRPINLWGHVFLWDSEKTVDSWPRKDPRKGPGTSTVKLQQEKWDLFTLTVPRPDSGVDHDCEPTHKVVCAVVLTPTIYSVHSISLFILLVVPTGYLLWRFLCVVDRQLNTMTTRRPFKKNLYNRPFFLFWFGNP